MVKSMYIHIPFCDKICPYCDFAKIYYQDKFILNYLKSLQKEIDNRYQGEILETIYIGGGTPSSLKLNELEKLLDILNSLNKSETCEYTFEANPESLTIDKLKLLKRYGVNRLSIGVQTFNSDHIKYLNRSHTNDEVISVIKNARDIGFNNINIDLIYGLPNQTMDDVKKDIDKYLELDIEHISTYSLIIEEKSIYGIKGITNIDNELESEMYSYIIENLTKKGYIHYEFSNFSKPGYESIHNLTYWNSSEYYGIGLGAHGYLNGKRYENTKSINKYLLNKYDINNIELSFKEKIEEFMFLGLRKIEGISKSEFKRRFNTTIDNWYGKIINRLIKDGYIEIDGDYIRLTKKGLFLANDVLYNFLIDEE